MRAWKNRKFYILYFSKIKRGAGTPAIYKKYTTIIAKRLRSSHLESFFIFKNKNICYNEIKNNSKVGTL